MLHSGILDAGSHLWGVLKTPVSNAGSAPQSFLLYRVLFGTLQHLLKVFLVEGGGMEETLGFPFGEQRKIPFFCCSPSGLNFDLVVPRCRAVVEPKMPARFQRSSQSPQSKSWEFPA